MHWIENKLFSKKKHFFDQNFFSKKKTKSGKNQSFQKVILSLFWYQGLQPWYLHKKSFDTGSCCLIRVVLILIWYFSQNDTLIPLLFFLISVTKNGTCYRSTFFLLLFFVLIWYVLFFLWRSKRVISCHLLVSRNGVIFFCWHGKT